MSAKKLKGLIEQAWVAVIKSDYLLEIVESTDPASRKCLVIVLDGINQFRIYPLNSRWSAIQALPFIPMANWQYTHYKTESHDIQQIKIAKEIILILVGRLIDSLPVQRLTIP